MTISDKIQLIAIVLTLITSTISIIIAVISLQQTNKSIINANKSDVVIYSEYIQLKSRRVNYLVIKNFGKSSAVIDSITFSNNDFYANTDKPFYNLKECSIAPNQSFSTVVKYKRNPYVPFDIYITYHDEFSRNKKIKRTFCINTESIAKQLVSLSTSSDQGPLEETITTLGQEFLRKNL